MSTSPQKFNPDSPLPGGTTVKVELDEGIAWVKLNRPDKRNAMSLDMAYEMNEVLDALELDDRVAVLVLTGEGEAFSAGMDLQNFFRTTDAMDDVHKLRAYRENRNWQWRKLMWYNKPTIAMVNGWCFGGAFTPLVCCDLAYADENATFGLSEINWGIIPGGFVPKAVSTLVNNRHALYYVMTGEPFDGRTAAEIGLVNKAFPKGELRAKTRELALTLAKKNPQVMRASKHSYKHILEMSWEQAGEYLMAKGDQTTAADPEGGRSQGMKQFLEDKVYKPGLGNYKR